VRGGGLNRWGLFGVAGRRGRETRGKVSEKGGDRRVDYVNTNPLSVIGDGIRSRIHTTLSNRTYSIRGVGKGKELRREV